MLTIRHLLLLPNYCAYFQWTEFIVELIADCIDTHVKYFFNQKQQHIWGVFNAHSGAQRLLVMCIFGYFFLFYFGEIIITLQQCRATNYNLQRWKIVTRRHSFVFSPTQRKFVAVCPVQNAFCVQSQILRSPNGLLWWHISRCGSFLEECSCVFPCYFPLYCTVVMASFYSNFL